MEKVEINNWPAVEGRISIGNPKSCVAVCTNASIDEIKIDMSKIAILGKCVTENVGIEKIIENIISNPNIRFLINCGKQSKGHFVEQALDCLKYNGIDENGKIIEAKGAMAEVKNIPREHVERFRKQVEIINIIGETASEKIEKNIDTCILKNPGAFSEEDVRIQIKDENISEIQAEINKEFIPDPSGYFRISISRNNIIVDNYCNGKLNKRIVGKNAIEIGHNISRLGLISCFSQSIEHALDIGQQLQRAEIALKHNVEFIQDNDNAFEEFEFRKIEIPKNIPQPSLKNKSEDYEWHD